MTLSPSGVLAGTPTTPCFFCNNLSFQVSDGTDTVGRGANVNISAVEITSPGLLPNAAQGYAYSTTISAFGGTGIYTFSITGGSLPGGLVLNASTGVISGTVNAGAGAVRFTVTAKDTLGQSDSKDGDRRDRRAATAALVRDPGDDCTIGVPCVHSGAPTAAERHRSRGPRSDYRRAWTSGLETTSRRMGITLKVWRSRGLRRNWDSSM
jgi:hypothetical protein